MVLIYENTKKESKIVGVADNIKKAREMFEAKFNGSSTRGYFMNDMTKGIYKPEYTMYSIGLVHEYVSSCDDDPLYQLVPIELNTWLPGCETLPTTSYD